MTAEAAPSDLDLVPALDGARHDLRGKAGRISYYVEGEGPPKLLVHSINAAASAYEMKPIYDELRRDHRTYAVDLPGFGFADRSKRMYDVRLYVDAIHDMMSAVLEQTGVERMDVIALSLGSEFAARAAVEAPERFRSLTLITPTGFSAGSSRLRQPGVTKEVPGLHAIFTVPLWSRSFFQLLTSRSSIRFFLRKTFGTKDIDEGLLEYDYLTSNQPGAEHAPYAFVSGRLFSKDIRAVYERLDLPVWLPHGTKGDFRDFTEVDWTQSRPNWRVEPFETGAMPHFEQPEAFFASYANFMEAVATRESAE